jgi:hypothetical protein
MKVKNTLPKVEFLRRNVEHSDNKWISKVSIFDTEKYLGIISAYEARLLDKGSGTSGAELLSPILCLAVRNGREVDLFRIAVFHKLVASLIKRDEIKSLGFRSRFVSGFESIGRSDLLDLNDKSVVGLELSPKGRRKDVLVGSFDDMPEEWTDKFSIVYTNSFDHSYDPYLTASQIIKTLRNGGYVVLAFPTGQDTGDIDPVAELDLDDVKDLFGNNIIYHRLYGSRWYYSEYIIRVQK